MFGVGSRRSAVVMSGGSGDCGQSRCKWGGDDEVRLVLDMKTRGATFVRWIATFPIFCDISDHVELDRTVLLEVGLIGLIRTQW